MDNRIQKIVERWYLNEPALFQVYCTHNLEQNSSMSCPLRCGKGKIEYNQELINSLSKEQLEAHLKAEIIRILLKHPYERQPDGCKHKSTSVGSNLVLSDNYDFTSIELPKPSDYGLNNSESFEWYSLRMEEYFASAPANDDSNNKASTDNKDNSNESFEANNSQESEISEDSGLDIQLPDGTIMTISSTEAKTKQQTSSNNNNPNQSEASDDEHPIENRLFNSDISLEDLSSLWEEDSVQQCAIDVAIDEIESVNGWGSLAGRISQQIVANTKARIDYRKVLAGFRASILSSKRHLTRMRPNRRSGFDNMGCLRRFDTNILVAVDVSGSVNDKTLAHFYSIINRAFKYGIEHIDTIQFDTELKEVQTFEKAQKKHSCFRSWRNKFSTDF